MEDSGQPDYLNAVVEGNSDIRPYPLFRLCRMIEHRLGRVRQVKWGPRTIDLDILAIGRVIHHQNFLQIPHPGLKHRCFVLVPLQELNPHWIHPVSGEHIHDLVLSNLPTSLIWKWNDE